MVKSVNLFLGQFQLTIKFYELRKVGAKSLFVENITQNYLKILITIFFFNLITTLNLHDNFKTF